MNKSKEVESMQGYQLSFFTQQDRTHKNRWLGDWLLEEARCMGIKGATLFTAAEGFGRERTLHFAGYFDVSDQPIEVSMAVSEDDAKTFLEHLKQEGINVFYTKSPIEFGTTDDC
jgi:PII-like signaling protein